MKSEYFTMATAIAQILNENSNYLYWGSHATEVADNLVSLQQAGSMVDVTLTAGGEAIKVHRMVLCASSPFLQINSEIPQLHPQPEETAILPVVEDSEPSETISLTLWESDLGTEDEDASVAIAEEVVDEKSKSDNTEPNRKKRRKMCSELSAREKKYSDETLEDALKEMKAGRNLCDVADSFGIPRSSLYMKARSSGVISPSNKVTYSNEQLQEAIEAVKVFLRLFCGDEFKLLEENTAFDATRTILLKIDKLLSKLCKGEKHYMLFLSSLL
ncbi:hypothetical protein B566_EDAN003018 [Ephemera danica]|nr:hypothetical protein B566_EDAN003018 [Ephemera danica]